jgi:hypothetical protein
VSDDIGHSVRERIAATTQVQALCSVDCIFADVLPGKPTFPAVVVFVSGHEKSEDLNSSVRSGPALVEVFAYGRDRAEANALAKAIRDHALPADLQGEYHGMDFREVSLVGGPAEVVDQPQDASDQWRRVTQQTFSIWAHAL